jgi:hypothetical protein
MRALALGLLLALPMLAGCLGQPAPGMTPVGIMAGAARLVCLDENSTRLCNFEATVEPQTRQANELSIAVNPTNPLNIIATGKDYTPDVAGDCVYDGLYATLDGGKTWTNQNVPGSPWKRLQDPSEPLTEFSNFYCVTDPVVAFGPDGTAYWTVMPYQCDPVSGSKTGRDLVPGSGIGVPATPFGGGGGFNDWFWTCSAMYVLVSEDGGLTWPTVREVAFGPRLEHDKQWMSAAPNGDVLLCWDRAPVAPSPGASPPVGPDNTVGAGDPGVVCSVSSDKGRSWSDFAYMTTQAGLPWVDYGPDNRAWAALVDDASVLVMSSDDGLTWGDVAEAGAFENPPPGGEYGWPVLQGSDFRTFTVPSIAVDRSAGPHGGRVYVAWFTHAGGDGDVVLSYSDDGTSWSEPRKVHDDDPTLKADQFMPAVSVGPDGTVDVSFYDRRWDPGNHLFDMAYTYSLDGGQTFAPTIRVSERSSDEQWSHHQNGMVFMGDYIDNDSSAGAAHLVWVDTRNQQADVFVATVMRPGANPG